MREIEESSIVNGEKYMVVCNDGVVRYLIAERCELNDCLEFVYYNIHGEEEYRTYSPDIIFEV